MTLSVIPQRDMKNKPVRLQGTWTSDGEMHRVTDFIRTQGAPEFITEIKQKIENNRPELPEMDESDDLYAAAMEVLRSTKRASTSSLQRRLKIGYNRAASLMDMLEAKGIIGPPTETGTVIFPSDHGAIETSWSKLNRLSRITVTRPVKASSLKLPAVTSS